MNDLVIQLISPITAVIGLYITLKLQSNRLEKRLTSLEINMINNDREIERVSDELSKEISNVNSNMKDSFNIVNNEIKEKIKDCSIHNNAIITLTERVSNLTNLMQTFSDDIKELIKNNKG